MNDERTPDAESKEQLGGDATRPARINSADDTFGHVKETNEPKVKSPRELDDALFAALVCRVHSDEARALALIVAEMVGAHELAKGMRKNKRKKRQAALSTAVERLLADLLLAQTSEKTRGYVYRSLRPAGFTESEVGYRVFKDLVDALVDLGLLETYKGFRNLRESFGGQKLPMIQKTTRFRATSKLLDICDKHGVRAADFHRHFLIPLPEHPLQLRASSKRNEYGDKIRGRPTRFEATAFTEKLEKQLKELNSFFDGFEMQGGIHRGYLRIFNNGDLPNFKWNMGGRLYSYGESNYQQMESEDRLRMTINGKVVCEIDIRASYLTIFHALCGEPFDAMID